MRGFQLLCLPSQSITGSTESCAIIKVRIKEYYYDEHGEKVSKVVRYDTTVGRAMLSEILPVGLAFDYINRSLKKKEISRLINASFRRCGLRETAITPTASPTFTHEPRPRSRP